MGDTHLTAAQLAHVDQLSAESRDALAEWMVEVRAWRAEHGAYKAMEMLWAEVRQWDRQGVEALACYALHRLADVEEW